VEDLFLEVPPNHQQKQPTKKIDTSTEDIEENKSSEENNGVSVN
jgi:hypothetical protein